MIFLILKVGNIGILKTNIYFSGLKPPIPYEYNIVNHLERFSYDRQSLHSFGMKIMLSIGLVLVIY